MKTGEKIQVIVISVVLAVVLAILYGRIYPSQTVAPGPGPTEIKPDRGGDTDDAPIIMAGGSILIGTDANGTFTRADDQGRRILKFEDKFKVFQIDLTDKQGHTTTIPATDLLAKVGKIEIDHCMANAQDQCVGQKDTVTLNFNNGPGAISLRNDHGKQIGKANRVLPTLWRHKIDQFVMLAVRVTIEGVEAATAACGKGADCDVVIHTCRNFANCVPK
jgi:hypothetical protein